MRELIVHGCGADEQPRRDLPVGFTAAHQGRDLRLLGGQLLGKTHFPLAYALAGGPQLHTSPLGEAGQAHDLEHVEGCVEVPPCLSPAALAA